MKNSRMAVTFQIQKNLAVPVLLGRSFIDKFFQEIFLPKEG